jgi:hypothetical protein
MEEIMRFLNTFRKKLLALACALLIPAAAIGVIDQLGGSAFPLTYITQSPFNLTDAFNQMLSIISTQTVGISTKYPGAASIPGNGTDVSSTTFSTGVQANPLVQATVQNVVVASVNATGGFPLISGLSGRTIYPENVSLLPLGGSPSAATRIMIVCTSGNILMSVPIAYLNSGISLSAFYPYSSTTIATGGNLTSTAFGQGCASGDSVLISNVGTSVATTTSFMVNLLYTVQ